MTFSNKIQAKTFKWPDMSFYARSLTWCAKQKESDKHASGRVVIYISVHLVSIYTLTFINVLLVIVMNLTVHKSSYCICSLAWCQARTFHLFTIWTLPLQMREYPLQYASTDKNKKSHFYNDSFKWRLHVFNSLFGLCTTRRSKSDMKNRKVSFCFLYFPWAKIPQFYK